MTTVRWIKVCRTILLSIYCKIVTLDAVQYITPGHHTNKLFIQTDHHSFFSLSSGEPPLSPSWRYRCSRQLPWRRHNSTSRGWATSAKKDVFNFPNCLSNTYFVIFLTVKTSTLVFPRTTLIQRIGPTWWCYRFKTSFTFDFWVFFFKLSIHHPISFLEPRLLHPPSTEHFTLKNEDRGRTIWKHILQFY